MTNEARISGQLLFVQPLRITWHASQHPVVHPKWLCTAMSSTQPSRNFTVCLAQSLPTLPSKRLTTNTPAHPQYHHGRTYPTSLHAETAAHCSLTRLVLAPSVSHRHGPPPRRYIRFQGYATWHFSPSLEPPSLPRPNPYPHLRHSPSFHFYVHPPALPRTYRNSMPQSLSHPVC